MQSNKVRNLLLCALLHFNSSVQSVAEAFKNTLKCLLTQFPTKHNLIRINNQEISSQSAIEKIHFGNSTVTFKYQQI